MMLDNMPICALLDVKLRERLVEIIASRGITTVVETGIDRGGSTMLFSEMVPNVFGVDNDRDKVDIVLDSLRERGINNVTIIHGDSPLTLRELVRGGFDVARTLFFLDAHWQAYWPLKDEIREIPRGQGVLVMHDARVPGCPNLGVDEYNGQELSYEYLKDVLTEWSPTHVVEYNDDTAEFPRRGVMFVYPS
jgi:predicted O-methyltransferase YrrM